MVLYFLTFTLIAPRHQVSWMFGRHPSFFSTVQGAMLPAWKRVGLLTLLHFLTHQAAKFLGMRPSLPMPLGQVVVHKWHCPTTKRSAAGCEGGLTTLSKQAMFLVVKAVIPAPSWLRKAMDDSLKRQTTSEKALLQTQNMLKQRVQRSPAKRAGSSNGPIKRAA